MNVVSKERLSDAGGLLLSSPVLSSFTLASRPSAQVVGGRSPRPNSDAHDRLPVQDFRGVDHPVAVRRRVEAPILRWQAHVRLGPLVHREARRQRELEALYAGQLVF